MAIIVAWADAEKRLLLMKISGIWTSEDFAKANQETLTLIRTVTHPVDLLADAREAQSMPKDIFKILHSALSLPDFPKNARSQIIVSENRAIQVMANFAQKVSPFSMKTEIVNSMDAAYQLIADLREMERR